MIMGKQVRLGEYKRFLEKWAKKIEHFRCRFRNIGGIVAFLIDSPLTLHHISTTSSLTLDCSNSSFTLKENRYYYLRLIGPEKVKITYTSINTSEY
jgi:hypothetical protein